MARPTLMDALTRIAEPVVASYGLEIWGIEILQSTRIVIRLYVDVPLSLLSAAPTQNLDGEAAKAASESSDEISCTSAANAGSIFAQAEESKRPSATIDQCADISRHVGLALEVEDIFSDAYVLEVSSPGLSRSFFHLAQLRPYVGDVMELVLNEAQPQWPGRKKFSGTLTAVTDTTLSLLPTPQAAQAEKAPSQTNEAASTEAAPQVCVSWEEVRKINRVHVFHEPVKPGKGKRTENK